MIPITMACSKERRRILDGGSPLEHVLKFVVVGSRPVCEYPPMGGLGGFEMAPVIGVVRYADHHEYACGAYFNGAELKCLLDYNEPDGLSKFRDLTAPRDCRGDPGDLMSSAGHKFIKRRHHFDRKGPVVAIEYPLPGDSLSKVRRQRIAPWLTACIGCGPDEVRDRLKQRWADSKGTGIGVITRFFGRMTPYSILVKRDVAQASGDAAWLILRDRSNEDFETGREWFLPPPTPAEVVTEALGRFQIRQGRCLEAFLREFAGFREDLPNVSGFFPHVQDWLSFEHYTKGMGWEPKKTPRVWAHAAVIYESKCGDVIVLDRTARLAWWDHDDDKFRILFNDFKQFPAHWLKYLRRNYPLSAWAPQ